MRGQPHTLRVHYEHSSSFFVIPGFGCSPGPGARNVSSAKRAMNKKCGACGYKLRDACTPGAAAQVGTCADR